MDSPNFYMPDLFDTDALDFLDNYSSVPDTAENLNENQQHNNPWNGYHDHQNNVLNGTKDVESFSLHSDSLVTKKTPETDLFQHVPDVKANKPNNDQDHLPSIVDGADINAKSTIDNDGSFHGNDLHQVGSGAVTHSDDYSLTQTSSDSTESSDQTNGHNKRTAELDNNRGSNSDSAQRTGGSLHTDIIESAMHQAMLPTQPTNRNPGSENAVAAAAATGQRSTHSSSNASSTENGQTINSTSQRKTPVIMNCHAGYSEAAAINFTPTHSGHGNATAACSPLDKAQQLTDSGVLSASSSYSSSPESSSPDTDHSLEKSSLGEVICHSLQMMGEYGGGHGAGDMTAQSTITSEDQTPGCSPAAMTTAAINTATVQTTKGGQSMGQSSGGQTTNQHMGQNVNQNVNQNIGQSMGQNMDQNMNQHMGQIMNQNMGQIMNQNMGQDMGQNIGQNMGQKISQNMGQNMNQNVNQSMCQNMNQNMGQNMGQNIRQNVSQFGQKSNDYVAQNNNINNIFHSNSQRQWHCNGTADKREEGLNRPTYGYLDNDNGHINHPPKKLRTEKDDNTAHQRNSQKWETDLNGNNSSTLDNMQHATSQQQSSNSTTCSRSPASSPGNGHSTTSVSTVTGHENHGSAVTSQDMNALNCLPSESVNRLHQLCRQDHVGGHPQRVGAGGSQMQHPVFNTSQQQVDNMGRPPAPHNVATSNSMTSDVIGGLRTIDPNFPHESLILPDGKLLHVKSQKVDTMPGPAVDGPPRSENQTAKQHMPNNFQPQSPINIQNPVNGRSPRNVNPLQANSPMDMQNAWNVPSPMSVQSAANPQSPFNMLSPAQSQSSMENSMDARSPMNMQSPLNPMSPVTSDTNNAPRQTPRPAQHSAPFHAHPTSPPSVQGPMSYQSPGHMHQHPNAPTNWQTAMQQQQQHQQQQQQQQQQQEQQQQQPTRNVELNQIRPPLQPQRNVQSQVLSYPHMVKQDGGQPYPPANWQITTPEQSLRMSQHPLNNHNYRQPMPIPNVPSQSHLQATASSLSHYGVRPGAHTPWQHNMRMQNGGNPSMGHFPYTPQFTTDSRYSEAENYRIMIFERHRQDLHRQMQRVDIHPSEMMRHQAIIKEEMRNMARMQEEIEKMIFMKRREEEKRRGAPIHVKDGMNRLADAPNEMNRHAQMQEEMRRQAYLQEEMRRQAYLQEEMRRQAFMQEEMRRQAIMEERIRRARIEDEMVRRKQLVEQQRILEGELKRKNMEMEAAMLGHKVAPTSEQVTCGLCGVIYANRGTLGYHMRTRHPL